MTDANTTPFPLQTVEIQDLQRLAHCIWNWKICDLCDAGGTTCTNTACSWSRTKRLENFWERYRQTTAKYIPQSLDAPALRSHKDLLDVIDSIMSNQDLDRNRLLQHNFVDRTANSTKHPHVEDQNQALNIAASILFMTNCGTPSDCTNVLENDCPPFSWRGALTASGFVAEAYLAHKHPYFDHGAEDFKRPDVVKELSATKLAKFGFKLEPTSDLRSHLLLIHERKTIRIFHASAVLKETLIAEFEGATKCTLPHAIAFETLSTIYDVLFPGGPKSYNLLKSLTSEHGFDKDLLEYEAPPLASGGDEEISYDYFGHRLAEIYDEIQKPSPHGRIERWLERKSGQRYMLLATMVGVFIAVILGFLGLVVAIFQTWLTYQQWQHPRKGE
jgi:hypothetical protein